jgi:hypothetical protein
VDTGNGVPIVVLDDWTQVTLERIGRALFSTEADPEKVSFPLSHTLSHSYSHALSLSLLLALSISLTHTHSHPLPRV